MWLLVIVEDVERSISWWQVLIYLASAGISALGYHQFNTRRRSPLLDDPDVTTGLSAEQRLRLELGLIDSPPELGETSLGQPVLLDDNREIAAAVNRAREDSRRRERDDLGDLTPAQLAQLRVRMDHILRERWAALEEVLGKVRLDHTGDSWPQLLDGDGGALALLYDLAAEVHAAKRQATFPPVALQLEGPLITLHGVLRHAQQSVAPETAPQTAQSLRASVLDFLERQLPGICENIRETEVKTEGAEDTSIAYNSELTNQDLPTV